MFFKKKEVVEGKHAVKEKSVESTPQEIPEKEKLGHELFDKFLYPLNVKLQDLPIIINNFRKVVFNMIIEHNALEERVRGIESCYIDDLK